jgi:glycosyltransferase involved in cell wall biosynthesis
MVSAFLIYNPYSKHPGGGKIAQSELLKIFTSIYPEVKMFENFWSLFYFLSKCIIRSKRIILIQQGVFTIRYVFIDLLSILFSIDIIVIPRGDYVPDGSEKWVVPNKLFKILLWKLSIKRRLEKAKYVVFTSELERDRYFNVGLLPMSHTLVVPDAFEKSERFKDIDTNKLGNQKINYSYFLFVGRISIEKNLIFLVDVYYSFFERNNFCKSSPHLVFFTPTKTGEYYDLVISRINDYNLAEYIHFFNEDDYKIETIYNHCILNLLPSHIESFGLTVLEALVFKKKTIVSENCPWYYSRKMFVIPINLNVNSWRNAFFEEFNNSSPKMSKKECEDELSYFKSENLISKWSEILHSI